MLHPPGEGSPVFVGMYRLFGSSGAADVGPRAALGPEPRHVATGVGHRAHADYMITNLDWHVSYRAPSLGVGLRPETLSPARPGPAQLPYPVDRCERSDFGVPRRARHCSTTNSGPLLVDRTLPRVLCLQSNVGVGPEQGNERSRVRGERHERLDL